MDQRVVNMPHEKVTYALIDSQMVKYILLIIIGKQIVHI